MSKHTPGSIYVHRIGGVKVPEVVLRFRGTPEEQAAACRAMTPLYGNPGIIAAASDLLAVARIFLANMQFDGAECTCEPGDVCPLCRTKAAIALAEPSP